ncbi:hypothetical protein AVEN_143362-1 [Araneus ventricosus]|uniref:Uncharacterized protein n=1 Tax=Araneus ventricosus TaxID=182803 RepID=A0A4Y2AFF5_ARAVE|nr:hypothetical protein AVEN_143362-1 [Araneus ventricosus]
MSWRRRQSPLQRHPTSPKELGKEKAHGMGHFEIAASWDDGISPRTTLDVAPKVGWKNHYWPRQLTQFINDLEAFPMYLHRFRKHHDPLCACGEEGSSLQNATKCPLTSAIQQKETSKSGTLWRAVSGFGRHLITRTWQHVTSNYAASVKVQLLPVHDILQTLHDPHRERLVNRMREIMNEYSVVDLNTLTDNIMQDSSLVRKIIIKYLVEYLTEEMSLPVRLPTRDDSMQHAET